MTGHFFTDCLVVLGLIGAYAFGRLQAGRRAGTIAAEAYQVIGNIADAGGLFDNPEVIRALDYFSGDALDGSILPFGKGLNPS